MNYNHTTCVLCCVQCVTLAGANVCSSFSLICDELDRPIKGEEEEKSEDLKESEKDATERRKIRGDVLKSEFQVYFGATHSINRFPFRVMKG